jgi:hypothetical protein
LREVVKLAEEARKKEAREEEKLLKVLAGGVSLATFAMVLQLLLSRLFARPAPVAMPAYDYVIDIYSDKVVITASDGSTTTLNTVADLNSWLMNVRGKRIMINTHVVVTQDLVLTSNEYWIFGEWVEAYVFVTERNTTIISFAPLGSDREGYYVINMDPETGEDTDVSGLKLFAVYADVDIWGSETFTVSNISVHILSSMFTSFNNVSGDVYAVGNYVQVFDSALRRAYIYALDSLWMDNVKGMGYGSAWCIVSLFESTLTNVALDDVDKVYICVRKPITASLQANTSQTFSLLSVTDTKNWRFLRYTVEAFGRWCSTVVGNLRIDANEPPPSGVTYSIDLSARSVTITNSTTSLQNIVLIYRLEVHS